EIASTAAPSARWGGRRAAIARVAGVALEDRDALAAIGARAFAAHLRGDQPRQLVQRLPRVLGLRLAPELAHRAGASEPPPWLELVAGVVA
ncbi:MAG: hypothetical protein K8W52_34625, partial [Deltaproteobacteria bacterium]|nr:hypothetical protein [Deltaproteobacteria bacterium]